MIELILLNFEQYNPSAGHFTCSNIIILSLLHLTQDQMAIIYLSICVDVIIRGGRDPAPVTERPTVDFMSSQLVISAMLEVHPHVSAQTELEAHCNHPVPPTTTHLLSIQSLTDHIDLHRVLSGVPQPGVSTHPLCYLYAQRRIVGNSSYIDPS